MKTFSPSVLGKFLGAGLLALTLSWGWSPIASAKDVTVPFKTYEPWSEEAKDEFRNLLVQEGGRVKPVHTYSRFMLLQFSGRTKLEFQTGDGVEHEIEAVEWLMDTLFRAEVAADLPFFIVDDSEAVLRLGVEPKQRRDRYSYNDLFPGVESQERRKLSELAAEYSEKKQNFDNSDNNPAYELSRIERMVLVLGQNVSSFEYLISQFDFARKESGHTYNRMLPVELQEMTQRLEMTEMLEKMPEMAPQQLMQAIRMGPSGDPDAALLQGAMQLFFVYANSGRGFAIFPPPMNEDGTPVEALDPDDSSFETWLSIGDVMFSGLQSKEDRPWALERMLIIQSLVDAASTEGSGFADALRTFKDQQRAEVNTRGLNEGDRSEMEVNFYQRDFFTNALVWFILSFILLAFSWLAPESKASKFLTWAVIACLVAGLLYTITGITLRCLIRHRPPITNLYDTVIFITGVGVVMALLMERFTKLGIGLMVATVIGAAGMFLSIKYEAKEATDTMGQLVAVLDTNFWLATHVTIINIGYAAGVVAAFFGVFYLVGRNFVLLLGGSEVPIKVAIVVLGMLILVPLSVVSVMLLGFWGLPLAPVLFGLLFWRVMKTDNPDHFFRDLTRMNYGIICFCLLFSLVGTILGGIWANYSWGRFWGWDPKENGALMICLWTLVILHGRMGGYLRDIGINVNAVLLGIIVTFSWWGVNNLGVGLHSYGFTSGIWMWLGISWIFAGLVMLAGLPLWIGEKRAKQLKKQQRRGSGGDGGKSEQDDVGGAAPTTA